MDSCKLTALIRTLAAKLNKNNTRNILKLGNICPPRHCGRAMAAEPVLKALALVSRVAGALPRPALPPNHNSQKSTPKPRKS